MQNRLITINLRKYLSKQPRGKRSNKAIKLLRGQVSRFVKIRPENVRISQELNALVFKRYSSRLTPIKVNVNIDNERATVTPFVEKIIKKEVAKPEKAKETVKRAAETKK